MSPVPAAVQQEMALPAIEYFPAGYVNQAKDNQEHNLTRVHFRSCYDNVIAKKIRT